MTLRGHVFTAPNRLKGFDTNDVVNPIAAAAFYDHRYRFCVRYVRRRSPHSYDLSPKEARDILASGLGLMVVQHVAPEGWTPTAALGVDYGNVAASEAERIGVPAGVTVWCDLEGVAPDTAPQQVIDFCNRWHAEVAAAGFVPGLYVGFGGGLTPDQLYRSLRFTHYWGAYNLDVDKEPTVRGLQMKQRVRRARDKVPGFGALFQVNLVRTDALGGRPALLAPESWLA
jgi:Domain of unknown function (DUF1906)